MVASCDCARLGTRARVAGWGLLVFRDVGGSADDGEEMPFAGHAFELVGAVVFEFKP